MSVVLRQENAVECGRRARELGHLGVVVGDTLVFFGGFVGRRRGGGQGVTQKEDGGGERTSWTALEAIRNLPKVRRQTGSKLNVIDFDPRMYRGDEAGSGLRQSSLIGEAMTRVFGPLSANGTRSGGPFDPRGALIVYGYSAGGFNAVRFCERILGEAEWYNFRRKTVGRLGNRTAADLRDGSSVRVDLLVTVDASIANIDPGMAARFNTPIPLVLRHVNYHQNRGRYQGRTASLTEHNQPLRGSHEEMPVLSLSSVLQEIGNSISGQSMAGQ